MTNKHTRVNDLLTEGREPTQSHSEAQIPTPIQSSIDGNTLRRMVERLIIENRNSLNDPTTNEPYDVKGIADDVIDLFTDLFNKQIVAELKTQRYMTLAEASAVAGYSTPVDDYKDLELSSRTDDYFMGEQYQRIKLLHRLDDRIKELGGTE